jgi:acyl carrier protein
MASTKPSADAISTKFYEILIDLLGIDREAITRDANIVTDLGADELDIVEMAMRCEEELGIELDDEKVDRAETVGAFESLLQKTI